MSNSRIWLIAFLTGFSGAMMPGPMLALVVGAVGAQGFWAAPIIVGGHALLEVITVLLLIAGLSATLQRPSVRAGMGLVGGLALVWMGVDMLHSASSVALDLNSTHAVQPWWLLMFWGAAVCVANPYFTGWWATIGAGQMAHLQLRSKRQYLSFYFGHELSDLVWYALVGIVVATGKDVFGEEVYQALVGICGVALVALAAWFLYSGLQLMWFRGSRDS